MVVGSEIDRYLLDPIEKPNNLVEFKILDWRTRNGSKYHTLAIVASDVLVIQVSAVASESGFSTGKRVIDPHRISMTPQIVEALICLQNKLKSDSVMRLSYLPTVEEIEFYEDVEKEQLEEERDRLQKFQKTTIEKPTSDSKCGKVESDFVPKKKKWSPISHPRSHPNQTRK